MGRKMNCWEFMKCGREPKGRRARELGPCPAATNTAINGLNGGINGGRMCWAIVGTYSLDEDTRGYHKGNNYHCYDCDFHRKVKEGILKRK
jgi:hypothetical protein